MAVDSVQLLKILGDNGLVEAGPLDELARSPEAGSRDSLGLARVLVQRGWLTRYQAAYVLQGHGSELVLGPYRIVDRLGEGAMGRVYKAHHVPMNRTVALKIIRTERLASPESVARFYREVQAAAKLSHPNIVLAYDAGQVGATH